MYLACHEETVQQQQEHSGRGLVTLLYHEVVRTRQFELRQLCRFPSFSATQPSAPSDTIATIIITVRHRDLTYTDHHNPHTHHLHPVQLPFPPPQLTLAVGTYLDSD
ncbi:uncharacterized protein AKAW2_21353S [Aspergillus luchuensis]|uniref:Uncharacterized protein n=1 Tax=Aspergillus kawachii TaxID=1069201 RepID=A0A7R7W5L7_ASPKA|nr:uncharacterized protein AKAW2_21353S [Aspergillus luchuensis]BCR96413.1 hypothetical protein AKAW2_21353S [Aspergillus luchuensis]